MQNERLYPCWPTQFEAPQPETISFNYDLKYRVGTQNDTNDAYVFQTEEDGSILSYDNMMRKQDIIASRKNHTDLPIQIKNRFDNPVTREDILVCVNDVYRINLAKPSDTEPRFGPNGLAGSWNS